MISFDLTGKVAVVTGASSGLGQQFARALSEQGCDVAILARRKERLEEFIDLTQKILNKYKRLVRKFSDSSLSKIFQCRYVYQYLIFYFVSVCKTPMNSPTIRNSSAFSSSITIGE